MSKFQGSKKEIAKLIRLPETKVHYYTDLGLVIPDIANPKGKGTTRIYSFENIIDFLIVSKLVGYGLSLKVIKEIMDDIRVLGKIKTDYYNRLDGSRFYLIIYNLNTDNLNTDFIGHEDPEIVVTELLKQGLSKDKIQRRKAELKRLGVNIFDNESVLVLNLSSLASLAASLV